jgi:histidinol-phosphate aminotransferase
MRPISSTSICRASGHRVIRWPSKPRVVVARTFSKVYGMAGLRLGYAIGTKDTLAKMAGFQLRLEHEPAGPLGRGCLARGSGAPLRPRSNAMRRSARSRGSSLPASG